MEAEERRTTKEDNSEKVSGTLDAIALYIAQQYGLTKSEAAKAAALMWLEHECDLAEKSDERKINGNLKSLSDFEEEEGQPAQGMVFQSRVFLNVSKLRAEALKEIPSLLVEELLSSDGPAVKIVRMICKCALSAKSALKYVPEGLTCVCMRAWKCVNSHTHVPFSAKDVFPERESEKDQSNPFICAFSQGDRTQKIGHATIDCPLYKSGNYCDLSEDKICEMLGCLEKLGVIEKSGEGSYAFL